MRKRTIGILFVLVLFTALLLWFLFQPEKPPISFYYWKQSFSLDKKQQQLLNDCKSEEMFVKFFDVVLTENTGVPAPVSVVQFKQRPKLNIIPCVFFQNGVFQSASTSDKLAENVLKLIHNIADKNHLKLREIQIDCDWTESTEANYFAFLKKLQQLDPKIVFTSTIRLHQIKYQAQTGIPPVKKGVLMCYNMEDLDQFTTNNSIISVETLKKYITSSTDYPIELDLALPIYQWGLVFRLGKLSLIANDISENDLREPRFTKVKPNVYQVNQNGYLNDSYLCKGDLLRIETSSPETLHSIAAYFNESDLTFNRLILFHISQQHISPYDENSIEKIRHLIP